jgi:hypothetical protein
VKKQTAAQLRAAQAVVDREEAIEAEREYRRVERVRKAKEARSAWLSKQMSLVRGASGAFGKFLWYLLGQITQVVIGGSAVMGIGYFLTTAGSKPDLGTRLQASIEFTFSLWSQLFGWGFEAGGFWFVVLPFSPWYIAFFVLVLALRVLFPLVRFLIRKAQR